MIIQREAGHASSAEEPYVGPRPFKRDDADKLFGRDDELAEILSLIDANSIVCLYAQSGAGKTSLLNAKILPELEARPSELIGPLRFAGPVSPSVLKSSENVYVYKALTGASLVGGSAFWRWSGLSLTRYLASRKKPPIQTTMRMQRVIVFDQFEELFTLHPERWKDRRRFFDDVAEAISADSRLRVVFAMREEFLGAFDAHSSDISPRLIGRFRLERLRRTPALDAVNRPLDPTPVRFRKGADERLVDNLLKLVPRDTQLPIEDEFVEPLQLQLVCQQIWRRLPTDASEIDEQMVKTSGSVEEALGRYYDEVISRIVEATGIREGTLRMWFERQLITDDGNRSTAYRGKETTATLPNKTVELIEKEYIIRSEPRGGGIWYELSHDRFIEPIVKSNAEWRRQQDSANHAGYLEARAAEWNQLNRLDELLLIGMQLRTEREWIKTQEAADLGISKLAEEYVKASDAAHQAIVGQRSRLKRTVYFLAGVVAVLLALLVAGYMLRGKKEAEKARTRAYIEVAESLTDDGRPIDALVWSLKGLTGGNQPTAAAAALRRSLALLDGAEWIERPKAPFTGVRLSNDGSTVVTLSASEICMWRADGRLLRCKPAPPEHSWRFAGLSPMATWAYATAVRIEPTSENPQRNERAHISAWRTASGDEDSFIVNALRGARGFVFSTDDRILVATGQQSKLEIYDPLENKLRCSIDGSFLGPVISSSGNVIAAATGRTGTTIEIRTLDCARITAYDAPSSLFADYALNRDGKTLVAAEMLGFTKIAVADTTTGKTIAQIDVSGDEFSVSPDGKQVAVLGTSIELFDARSGRKLSSRPRPRGRVTDTNGPFVGAAQAARTETMIHAMNVFAGPMITRVIPVVGVQSIDLDEKLQRVAVLAGGVVRVFDLREKTSYEKMTAAQLRSEACHALRNQPEKPRVADICK